jgi:enolase
MAVTIRELKTREILDSRGQPTLEVSCSTNHGQKVVAGVPAGASTGTREAVELRDGDPKRFAGGGALKADQEKRLREALPGPTTGSG